MSKLPLVPKSIIDGITWPALPSPQAARFLALIQQFNEIHWWEPEKILEYQFRQLSVLLEHASLTTPLYQQRLKDIGYKKGQKLTPDFWRQVPFLTRSDIQETGSELTSNKLPQSHGSMIEIHTSGSSGHPITTKKSALCSFLWDANTIHEHLLHNRELLGKHVFIRAEGTRKIPRLGLENNNWGTPMSHVFDTGQAALLDIQTNIAQQAEWLIHNDADYILTHPTNISAIAHYFIEHGKTLYNLKHIRTFGEKLDQSVRDVCREAWGVPVIDAYSAQEIGQMAFQCPEHEHYHILPYNVFLEILNDQGLPCQPGETGKVIVTPLHNFAMPLIRYEILDYAVVGDTCSCGRGLPVLKEVIGRQRNIMTLPNGEKHWPRFPAKMWADIAPIRQIQLIQHDLEKIEARIVARRKLTRDEEEKCKSVLTDRFGYPFKIEMTYFDEIPRSKNAKYEDFISMIK